VRKRSAEAGSRARTARHIAIVSPLATWLSGDAALARFRRTALGRAAAVLPPHDDAWRSIVPDFGRVLDLVERGLPFHVVRDREHDRSPDPARLRPALAEGATVLVPQAHQVLPRLARLIVALRATLFGPFREESSYLFAVDGAGREGMGLHHDGDTDGVWLQVQGRRTVTIGPRVAPGTPEELRGRNPMTSGRGWRTLDLDPGSLFYLPPRTPHRVVCRDRSLAVSLTWGPFEAVDALGAVFAAADGTAHGAPTARSQASPQAAPTPARLRRLVSKTLGAVRRRPGALAAAWATGLTPWDVASGRAEPWPADTGAGQLWVQAPVVAGPLDGNARRFTLWTPDASVTLPRRARPLAARLATMPRLLIDPASADSPSLQVLRAAGILAEEDLPLVVVPAEPSALDGWRFA
jgi:hypothetical protein